MPANEERGDSGVYELYLMRHGIASNFAPDGSPDDAKRRLTAEGRDKLEEIAKGFKRLDVQLDWILSSPLVRAAETAQIMRDGLGTDAPLEIAEALSPGQPAEKIVSLLVRNKGRKRVLLVGHEPDMSVLAGRLIGAGEQAHLAFKKGGCCQIIMDELSLHSPGQLLWWLTPRILRSLH